jgi:aldehyde dehydrogenase (NAD(P)+)
LDTLVLDKVIGTLNSHKDEWARLPIAEKIHLFQRVSKKTAELAENWVAVAVTAKSIPESSPLVGEEWASGPWALIYGVESMVGTLQSLDKGKNPPIGKVRTLPSGQVIADIFPYNIYQRLLLNGIRAEVWMQDDVTADNFTENMAKVYKSDDQSGQVSLVLGGGNIASIPPLDVLDRLFAHKSVCVLKVHPVNDYLKEIFDSIFEDFVSAGYLQIVSGGADVGNYLCQHEYIDHIHITGGAKTFESIVFGSGSDGQERKNRGEPQLDKSVTAELGCVTPTIVVPGPWSKADLKYQAENIATQKLHNGSFNCIASQILVLPEIWDSAEDLLADVKKTISSVTPREPYYPGAHDRYESIKQAYQNCEVLDDSDTYALPRLLITELDNKLDEYLFNHEVFVGALGQTYLPGSDPGKYLKNAVQFCNEKLWGTLGANILIHPKTMRQLGFDFENALADLRYGSIGVNAWCGLAFLTAECTWGAFPGHTITDIQSGIGVVHNTRLFEKPEKTVVYAPFSPFPRNILKGEFHIFPKPPWFVTNKQAHNVSRRFTYFQARPGPLHLPGLFFDALRG